MQVILIMNDSIKNLRGFLQCLIKQKPEQLTSQSISLFPADPKNVCTKLNMKFHVPASM